MAAWIPGRAALLIAALLTGALPLLGGGPPAYESWYPADISPPPGTSYPCALTPLPRDLPGIPPGDRRFINHVYTMILRSTQAKLALQKALAESRRPLAVHAEYRRATGDALQKIHAEPVPPGLEAFAQDVTTAIELQRTAFEHAVMVRSAGGPPAEEYRTTQARAASKKLMAAWGKMAKRYPDWSQETRDSVYHHLCALDLF